MRFLGNTLKEIANQKAGIIKEKSNTVIFSQTDEVDDVFIDKCRNVNNNLYIIKEDEIKNYKYDDEYQYFDYGKYKNVIINLKGKKQVNNSVLCIKSVDILNELGYEVSEKSMRQGLKTVIHKGRMEVLNQRPKIIFDGAHNEPAMQNFKDMVKMYYHNAYEKKLCIVSILKRKDYVSMLKVLLENIDADFIFTSGNSDERYVSGEELYKVACKYKKNQDLFVYSLEDAINKAIDYNYDVTFAIGSFYVYSDVVRILRKLNS